ncbi:hypothetical protein [Brevundimonas sp.]|uniref:hypothetical protein n=1 Tax=Brevundimonas sp. TaxID=1871086 RepID=UPI002D75FDF3|nr:hypothetical protein [Brevundimonas sp.]HYD28197.1 hypothetical protein [Brevundimonas sp.]
MRAVHALMMLLGALAVLMAGAAPANALGEASSPPPCHEAPMHHAGAETPSPGAGKAMKAMDCCIACVAAPAPPAPERARVTTPRPAAAPRPVALLSGEQPAPEPHPPRPGFL